jgi:hypothetical protein
MVQEGGHMFGKTRSHIIFIVALVLLAACARPLPLPKIDRQPAAVSYRFINPSPTLPPEFDAASGDPFQNDFRSADLRKLDLSQSLQGLLYSDFDSLTKWPSPSQLPAGFDPQEIMELGKDPGLGVRQLHSGGITGQGIGIAIIDQPMIVDHQEYAGQLKLYEEINIKAGTESQMHGPAVSSLAVGKTVGTAPGASLFFIANWPGTWGSTFEYDFSYLAQAVRRIIEIYKSLPAANKIRVLSMSIGWGPAQKGYDDMVKAVNEAKKAGIFVISMSIHDTYGWDMLGLGRSAVADPNDFASYLPSPWWSEEFYTSSDVFNRTMLLIPMDARTTASPTGKTDYAFYSVGGMSWTAPYLAGIYALACQVDHKITPDIFWSTALKTGRTIQIEHEGKSYSFGVILDPQALIRALEE